MRRRSPVEVALLLLFDIDGTLLANASQAHAEALHRALHRVYAVADTHTVPVQAAGRTDLDIARAILTLCDVSAARIDERLDDLREAACEEYADLCPPSLKDRLVPGVQELLDSLAERPATRLALVTGNLEPIARLKLTRAGIGQRFPAGQGGFGSDDEDRTALPPLARRRAGAPGDPYPREHTLVIGDTPRDIACAHADGLRCLAVTTGPFRAEQLREAGADAIARDARELRALLDAELARAG